MWHLAWIETRWRLALMAMVDAAICVLLLDGDVGPAAWARRLDAVLPMLFSLNAVMLAGAGIATRLSHRPRQSVDASMYFLLSLPVSRRRLVLVREATGALALVALVVAVVAALWAAAPDVRAVLPAPRLGAYLGAVLVAAGVSYAFSAVLATQLDQLWQSYVALGVVMLVAFQVPAARLWHSTLAGSVVASLPGLAAALLLAAALCELSVRLVQRREF